jgi:hypothetical protein
VYKVEEAGGEGAGAGRRALPTAATAHLLEQDGGTLAAEVVDEGLRLLGDG